MILEELVGALVSLASLLIVQAPLLSRQCSQIYDWLIFEDSREDDEGYEDLIHREYEEEERQEICSKPHLVNRTSYTTKSGR